MLILPIVLRELATEIRNVQTNMHDGPLTREAILESLEDWELRITEAARVAENRPTVVVTVEGGIVQGISANSDVAADFFVVDYDAEGATADEVVLDLV